MHVFNKKKTLIVSLHPSMCPFEPKLRFSEARKRNRREYELLRIQMRQNVNSKSFNNEHFSVIIFGFWSFICFNSSPKKNLNFVFIFSWSSISFFLTILFYCICTNNVIELRVEIFIKCHSKTGINWVYAKMEKIWNIFLKLHSNIQIDAIFIIQSFHRKLYLFVIFFPAI